MKKLLVLPVVALLAACSGGSQSSSLSLSARAGSVNSTTTTPPPAATGVSVTRIRVALRDLELRSRDGSHRAELALGPVVIDLGAADLTSAGVEKVLDSTVPAGTYDKIKFTIHRLQAADNVAGAADLVAKNASILIDGTFNGTAFQFATALEAEQELEGKFVIDATTQNITLNFDPSKWFVSGTTALDPTKPENELAIEANIRASLAAFQYDDGVGHENHHGDDDGADDDAGDDSGGGHGGSGGGGTDDGGGHH